MQYKFPRIDHLDEVRPAIEGRDEFAINDRGEYMVVNYHVNLADTFPPVETEADAIRRECRGMLFYPDGTIMSRRLHKFFNVNERDETQVQHIDLGKPHVILEKLDGSMITPVVTDAGLRFGTKMGITEVSMQAEEFVARHPEYDTFARWCLDSGWTPIFEWCSRKQRIVVDYPDDRLVLIAVRDTRKGDYVNHDWLQAYGKKFGVEVVKAYDGTTANMEHLIAETRATEGMEGWVIRFDDGHMVKVKGDWYVRIHKTKDNLLHEKNVIELLITEKMDDTKAFMLDDDRKRVEAFETDFWTGVDRVVKAYDHYFGMVVSHGMDRKQFALTWMPTVKQNDPFVSGIVFGKFDGKDTRKMVLDTITKHLGTQTKVDEARSLWGGFKWNYAFDGDV
jgi:RNA ligase